MKVLFALWVFLAAAVPAVVADTEVTLTNASCKSPWSVTDSSSGTIEVSSAFSADTEVKIAVTWAQITVANEQVNVCDYITPEDGQECGEIGTYSVDTSTTVPDSLSGLLSTGSYVSVTLTMADITTCSMRVYPAQSSSSMSMAAAALVGAMLVAGIYGIQRRVRRRSVQNDSIQMTLTDFEMPPEGTRSGVHV